jgi:hypothetical protein
MVFSASCLKIVEKRQSMIRTIKQILRKYFWHLIAFYLLILRKQSYLYSTGWVESIKRGYPCRADGSELPWINYPVIRILEERLRKDLNVFEFGSGHSTLFFAHLVRHVGSVENDPAWFDFMKARIPDNVTLLLRTKDTDGKYCRSISETKSEYDLVLVDGKDRLNCVLQAMKNLSARGVILLDDSERPEYVEGMVSMKKKGFLALTVEGLKPTGDGAVRTTIFYLEHNCLSI